MGRTRNIGKVEPVHKTWLSQAEAKAYLGCSDEFLQRMRDEARVTFSRYGGKMIWYELASIDRFLDSLKTRAAT